MKYTLCVIGLVCLAVGCTDSQMPTETPVTTLVTTEQHEYLEARVDSLSRELRELREYLEDDPNFLLRVMDRDLDAAERGEEPRGSFSDYFVPNAAKALEAGATREDVNARIDRVIVLAEKGRYLSSFVSQLMKEGGPTAVRSYADEWIRESQEQ
ncbi:MAG: hypothetical protein HYS78_02420 [Parcubacteria group bacterium]|nr:hypothetical protein [Parcubacteria group bacterium]